jgi:hypothetical protein
VLHHQFSQNQSPRCSRCAQGGFEARFLIAKGNPIRRRKG